MTFDHDNYLRANQSDFLLFVYGTLRSDAMPSNCGLLERHGGTRVRTGCTVRGRLHDLGYYPALVLDDDGPEVCGELWQVPLAALPAINRYEGSQYVLRDVLVHGSERAAFGANAYEASFDVSSFPVIPSGDWRKR